MQADVRWVWSGALGDKSVKVLADRALTDRALTGVLTDRALTGVLTDRALTGVLPGELPSVLPGVLTGYSRGYCGWWPGRRARTVEWYSQVTRVVLTEYSRRTHTMPWDCAGVAADGGGLSRGVRRALRCASLRSALRAALTTDTLGVL